MLILYHISGLRADIGIVVLTQIHLNFISNCSAISLIKRPFKTIVVPSDDIDRYQCRSHGVVANNTAFHSADCYSFLIVFCEK